ncbi:AAA family ATPase [Candidatus Gottesmanbacteria bacterium]|nr:AAA family ATPase [Candidatus Gottesmanbacteria bacterium]
MKLIAIVGMPGAGKSVAADFFRNKGISVLRFGDETDRGVAAAGKEPTEQNEREWREAIRRELGMAAMAIKIEPRIIEAVKEHDTIVLDGLYSWEEYVYLKEKFEGLTLLCIWAAPTVRYERLGKRAVRPLTVSEARSRDIAEIEQLNKGGPIAISDYLIENNSDQASFMDRLEQFFSTV